MVFENLTHWRAHRKLPETWSLDLAANAKHLRSPIFGQAEASEPIRSFVHDVVNITKRFYILDDRWLPPQSTNLREWGLRSRMRSLAFERIQQSRLFAADITSSARVNMKIKTQVRSENIV